MTDLSIIDRLIDQWIERMINIFQIYFFSFSNFLIIFSQKNVPPIFGLFSFIGAQENLKIYL